MKKIYPLLLIIPIFFSCVRMNQYTYLTTSDIPLYGPKGMDDVRYADIPAGDTVITYGEHRHNIKAVYYKSTPVITVGVLPQNKLIRQKRVRRKRVKTILTTRIPDSYKGAFALYSGPPISTPKSRVTETYTPSSGSTIHTGPRGGRYYINSNGNKTYLKSGSSTPSRSRSSSSYRRR